MAGRENKKRKRETSEEAPPIPCLDLVLSYLPYVELGDLAADVESPCQEWEDWENTFKAEHLWKEAAKGSFLEHAFFKDCKHLLQDTIALSQSNGMAENSFHDFFLHRVYPILQYARIWQQEYEKKSGKEWTKELDSELCLTGYFCVTKGSSQGRSFIGGNVALVSEECMKTSGAEMKKNELLVAQLDCSLFHGSLTAGGLLPTSGMLYYLLAKAEMSNGGGSVIHTPDTTAPTLAIVASGGAEGMRYPRRNVTGVQEVLVPSQRSKLDYRLERPVEKRAKKELSLSFDSSYFFGYRATSQQGNDQVEENQFLLLQVNIYGEQFMDGIENYFILPKEQLRREPKDFTMGEEGNFSLYANC